MPELETAHSRKSVMRNKSSTEWNLGRVTVLILLGVAALPVAIDGPVSFPLAPADAVAALLVPYVLSSRRKPPESKIILAGLFLSAVGILIFALDSSGLYSVATAAYFWKSWIFYVAAFQWVSQFRDKERVTLKLVTGVGAAIWVAVIVTLIAWQQSGALTRYGTHESGGVVLGYSAGFWDNPVKLYGFGQVNNTGALFAIGLAIFITLTLSGRGAVRVIGVTGTVGAMLVIAPSGSRGSLLAALAIIGVAFMAKLLSGRKLSVGALAALALIVGATVSFLPEILAASPKYLRTLHVLASPMANADVTSGRGDLAGIMVRDVLRSPIIGTGFGDFARFHPSSSELQGAAPHNTYIGPFHKGGILVGVLYLGLMFRVLPLRRGSLPVSLFPLQWPLALSLVGVLFLVTDVFTTSVVAATTLVILGALRACELDDTERPLDEKRLATEKE